jgi:putative glutamine amidotransferase
VSPLVGLSAYREQTRFGVWDTTADVLPGVYADAIVAAGGVPVLLPVSPPELAAEVVQGVNALVIAGGPDVSPERYGEQPHALTTDPRLARDSWELALLDAAEERGLPTLGVCRGMQLMAVRAGGALRQHLPDALGHDEHSPGGDLFGDTVVHIETDSLLHELESKRTRVHCHHHQAVLAHPGFRPVAWAGDGTLEAMEGTGDRFCVGVQWHPEMKADAGLFAGLVEAARRSG